MALSVASSELIEVAVEPDPGTLHIRGAGLDLTKAEPFGYSTVPHWTAGPDLPPDADPPARDWIPLTGVLSGREVAGGYEASLGTEDGRRAHMTVQLVGEGSVAIRVAVDGATVCGAAFHAEPGERWLGFGERSHAVSLERGVIENYVGEGPYQPHEYPFLNGIVPPWGIRNRSDATYFPVPWVLSTRGYGIWIERDEVSYLRFRSPDVERWGIEVESGVMAFTVFAGPSPLDALGRFTAATGRQIPPERWWFGPWYQSGHANHVPLEEEVRQADVLSESALSAAETHCRYLPLGEDRGYEASEQARTHFFHSRGLAVLSYINPLIGLDYQSVYDKAETRGALMGDPFPAYAGGREPSSTLETQFDFTHPEAGPTWGEVADRMVGHGFDGWMEDFGEYTPLDAVMADGSTGTAAHNRYPTLYHRTAAEVADELESKHGRRLVRFVRAGWTGTARYAPIVWGGDPTTGWEFDGLASAVIEGLSMGASGVAMWGSDTGGFLSSVDQLTPELLVRWIQFSAFSPVMRTKAGGIEIPPYDRPQIWDPDILPSWQHWAEWHTRLNDYLLTAHATYRRTGRPIMCALELEYPSLGPVDDQYLLGPDLLVAPVLRPGVTSRQVVLPPGRWWDLFGRMTPLEGPGTVAVAVGADDIPVFVKDGAVIGLLPRGPRSLSPYAPPPPDDRDVLVFPSSDVSRSGPLGPAHRYRIGKGSLTLDGPAGARWSVTVHRKDAPPSQIELVGGSVRADL